MTHMTTLSGDDLGALCFGTMQFGQGSDEAVSQDIYKACRAAGIRHFDTAWVYTKGNSERFLGQFVQEERDRVFIASKVGYSDGAGASNLTPHLTESLKRLDIDQIDLLYLHRFDPNTPLIETLTWFAEQQKQGLIRYIGLSNFAAWQIVMAQNILESLGTRVDAVQPMYSLVKRQAEVEIFPACEALGISCFSYSPLGAGLLTGKYFRAETASGRLADNARYAQRYHLESMHKTAADLVELSAAFEQSPATLAISWIRQTQFAPTPIISARTMEQLAPLLAAQQVTLTADQFAQVSEVSVSPPPATDRLEEAV